MEIINTTDGYKLGHHRMYPEEFNKWFAFPKKEAIKQFSYRVGNFVDINQVGTKHIEELYDLGHLPENVTMFKVI